MGLSEPPRPAARACRRSTSTGWACCRWSRAVRHGRTRWPIPLPPAVCPMHSTAASTDVHRSRRRRPRSVPTMIPHAPLRPLARILSARARGREPRHASSARTSGCATRRCATRPARRAEGRLLLLGAGLRHGLLRRSAGAWALMAATEPVEPRAGRLGCRNPGAARRHHRPQRPHACHQPADPFALCAAPRHGRPAARGAGKLARDLPRSGREDCSKRRFTDGRSFLWIAQDAVARTDAAGA